MGKIVGIDLGTTYSAVAIPEERNEEGFYIVRNCLGVSIIQDRFKNRITPSVVAEDGRGEIVIGRAAKNRAGFSPEPIMFAKRSMGEDVTFQLDKQGSLTPVDVSAHILRYLKEVAEERLGEPVDEAVITVPAYFTLRAKQATEQAGVQAGLQVAQVAPEPVAAALMYCAGNDRDPLRVMTYDLGGGTFDVAVLEKRDQTITADSMLTVDGDHFLGGYNFDVLLTDWLINEIRNKGYRLGMNEDDPRTRVTRAKLMVEAERAKIQLSRDEYIIFQEANLGINDDDGIPVSLEGIELPRSTFETMIEPLVERSINLCKQALEKATPPIEADSLDEILMVGGSSRIPMIGARLEAEFGTRPLLVEPDLCVCLGAAILAGTKAKSIGRFKLNQVPKETELPFIAVTGHVLPAVGGEDLAGLVVNLVSEDGSYNARRVLGGDGSFVFDQVSLTMDEEKSFNLILTDQSGSELDRYSFSVRNTMEGEGQQQTHEIPNVLSKPIQLFLRDGMLPIAPARTPLPYSKTITALTADTSGRIVIRVYEENNQLGEILLSDIPESLPIGSTVDIEVTIQNNYQIIGTAQVKALAQEASVVIDIPIPEKKSVAELQQEYEVLKARAEEVISAAPPGVRFGDVRVRNLRSFLKEVEEALGHPPVEVAMIQDRLDQVGTLIQGLSQPPRLTPPRSVFDARVEETREQLQRAIHEDQHVAEEGHDKTIDAIVNEAAKAFQAQDSAKWSDSYASLDAIYRRLEKLTRKDTGSQQPTDPAVYLLSFGNSLAALEDSARKLGKYEQHRTEFEKLASDLKRIDPQAPDAMAQITTWYFQGFENLRKKLDVDPAKIGVPSLGGK